MSYHNGQLTNTCHTATSGKPPEFEFKFKSKSLNGHPNDALVICHIHKLGIGGNSSVAPLGLLTPRILYSPSTRNESPSL
jgi:hypothetical protein